jgi:hypothetical protein
LLKYKEEYFNTKITKHTCQRFRVSPEPSQNYNENDFDTMMVYVVDTDCPSPARSDFKEDDGGDWVTEEQLTNSKLNHGPPCWGFKIGREILAVVESAGLCGIGLKVVQ